MGNGQIEHYFFTKCQEEDQLFKQKVIIVDVWVRISRTLGSRQEQANKVKHVDQVYLLSHCDFQIFEL